MYTNISCQTQANVNETVTVTVQHSQLPIELKSLCCVPEQIHS